MQDDLGASSFSVFLLIIVADPLSISCLTGRLLSVEFLSLLSVLIFSCSRCCACFRISQYWPCNTSGRLLQTFLCLPTRLFGAYGRQRLHVAASASYAEDFLSTGSGRGSCSCSSSPAMNFYALFILYCRFHYSLHKDTAVCIFYPIPDIHLSDLDKDCIILISVLFGYSSVLLFDSENGAHFAN